MTVTVAEAIAAVVADVRRGRFARQNAGERLTGALLERFQKTQPVVDTTAIYLALVKRSMGPGINVYDDFPSVIPPWPESIVAYVNGNANVIVMQAHLQEWEPRLQWETINEVEWNRVRWLVEASVWIGGRDGTGAAMPTTGPVRVLQHAVHDDGSPADMRWISLVHRPRIDDARIWEMPVAVFNAAFDFLSCKNVEIAEPARPFPVRQRLRKSRVQVQTIVVRPPGKRRAGNGGPAVRPLDAYDTPLTSVRGRFNHYGERYGRGKLFGKYEGRFWIPAHARGAGDGFEQKDYVLRPGKNDTNG